MTRFYKAVLAIVVVYAIVALCACNSQDSATQPTDKTGVIQASQLTAIFGEDTDENSDYTEITPESVDEVVDFSKTLDDENFERLHKLRCDIIGIDDGQND